MKLKNWRAEENVVVWPNTIEIYYIYVIWGRGKKSFYGRKSEASLGQSIGNRCGAQEKKLKKIISLRYFLTTRRYPQSVQCMKIKIHEISLSHRHSASEIYSQLIFKLVFSSPTPSASPQLKHYIFSCFFFRVLAFMMSRQQPTFFFFSSSEKKINHLKTFFSSIQIFQA